MELVSLLRNNIAASDPVAAAVFENRFQNWMNNTAAQTSVRHQLVIFLHVELDPLQDSINLRGYLSEQLTDEQFLTNFMLFVYPKLHKLWLRLAHGGVV